MTMLNANTGECVRTFDGIHTSSVYAVTIPMHGEKAAVIQARQMACLLSLSTGERQYEASYEEGIEFISLLPPDEKFVIIGTSDGRMELRDMESWSLVSRFQTSKTDLCFALSRDGKFLVSGGRDDNLRLLDMRSSAIEKKVPERSYDPFSFIRTSPDGSLMLCGRFEELEAHMWDGVDGRMESLPIDAVTSVNFSPDGKYVVLRLHQGICQLWNESMTTQILDSQRFRNIVFSPDGNLMALVSTDGGVQIVDSTIFQERMKWETSKIDEIEFSPNGQIVGLSKSDPNNEECNFELWNLPKRTRLRRTTLKYSRSGHIEFSPNGQVAAFWCESLETYGKWLWRVLEVATGKGTRVYAGDNMVFHPDSHLFAIEMRRWGSSGCYITTCETSTWLSRHELKFHGPVDEYCIFRSMAISKTGKLVAVSSRGDLTVPNGTVQLWDTKTGMEIGRYSIEAYINQLSLFDDRYLSCNQGRLPVPLSLPDQETDLKEEERVAQHSLFVGSQWVYQGLERILWLPPAYRSENSNMRGEPSFLHTRLAKPGLSSSK